MRRDDSITHSKVTKDMTYKKEIKTTETMTCDLCGKTRKRVLTPEKDGHPITDFKRFFVSKAGTAGRDVIVEALPYGNLEYQYEQMDACLPCYKWLMDLRNNFFWNNVAARLKESMRCPEPKVKKERPKEAIVGMGDAMRKICPICHRDVDACMRCKKRFQPYDTIACMENGHLHSDCGCGAGGNFAGKEKGGAKEKEAD